MHNYCGQIFNMKVLGRKIRSYLFVKSNTCGVYQECHFSFLYGFSTIDLIKHIGYPQLSIIHTTSDWAPLKWLCVSFVNPHRKCTCWSVNTHKTKDKFPDPINQSILRDANNREIIYYETDNLIVQNTVNSVEPL